MAGTESNKHRHRVPRLRSGIAVVETAVTLPLIVLFVVAMIQFANMIFLRQKVTSACYIGMQQLSQLSAKESSVHDAIEAILTPCGITGATIEILPAGVLDTAPMGTKFSIRVRAPFSTNLTGPKIIPTSGNVEVQQWIFR